MEWVTSIVIVDELLLVDYAMQDALNEQQLFVYYVRTFHSLAVKRKTKSGQHRHHQQQ